MGIHDEQKVTAHYAEMKTVLQADKVLVSELGKNDKTFQRNYETLTTQLKKKTELKKREDDEFFAGLDYAAYLDAKAIQASWDTCRKEIAERFAIDERRAAAIAEEQKNYREAEKQSHSTESPESVEVSRLMNEYALAQKMLEMNIRAYQTLQNHINQWPNRWNNIMQKAATTVATQVRAGVAAGLMANPALVALCEEHPELVQELDQKFGDMEQNLQAALATRATPESLIRNVAHLKERYEAKCNGATTAEEKIAAIEEVCDPVYRLNESINVAGNITSVFEDIRNMLNRVGMSQNDLLRGMTGVRFAAKYANSPACRESLGNYHQKMQAAYAAHVRDQTQLATLADDGKKVKATIKDTLEKIGILMGAADLTQTVDNTIQKAFRKN